MPKRPAPPRVRVAQLLAEVPNKLSKSVLATRPDLVEAVVEFLDLKLAKDPRAHMSFTWFYTHKLQAAFDGPHIDAVRNYIRNNLRRGIDGGNL